MYGTTPTLLSIAIILWSQKEIRVIGDFLDENSLNNYYFLKGYVSYKKTYKYKLCSIIVFIHQLQNI